MDDPCANMPCRAASTIYLIAGDKTQLRFDVARSAYLTSDGHIVIRPGERLVFRFPMQPDGPGTPQFVSAESAAPPPLPDLKDPELAGLDLTDLSVLSIAEEKHEITTKGDATAQINNEPAGTLIVTFRQITGTTGMMLDITHNFPRALKLDAFIMAPKPDRWDLQYTSTCAVLSNVRDTESWPELLGGVILEKFRYGTSSDMSTTGNETVVHCR
jgi:hypothetical protein